MSSNDEPAGSRPVHPIELFFSKAHPISSYLDVAFEGAEGGTVRVRVTGSPSFIRDNRTGELHSGFATLVLDSIMGGSVMGVLEILQPIATVGLSVNHLRRANSGETVLGKAVCTGVHGDLAYVTGELVSADHGDVLAIATGTFMIGTRRTSIRDRQSESRI